MQRAIAVVLLIVGTGVGAEFTQKIENHPTITKSARAHYPRMFAQHLFTNQPQRNADSQALCERALLGVVLRIQNGRTMQCQER